MAEVKFDLKRLDAALAADYELLKLQAQLSDPASSLPLDTLKKALECVDAHIREVSHISSGAVDFSAVPVRPAQLMKQRLKLRQQIEASIHDRDQRGVRREAAGPDASSVPAQPGQPGTPDAGGAGGQGAMAAGKRPALTVRAAPRDRKRSAGLRAGRTPTPGGR